MNKCPNCNGPLRRRARVHETLEGCVASLAAEIAALKSAIAPVRTPCDFCSRQSDLPVRLVDDDKHACDQCMTELFAAQSPPAEKAEPARCPGDWCERAGPIVKVKCTGHAPEPTPDVPGPVSYAEAMRIATAQYNGSMSVGDGWKLGRYLTNTDSEIRNLRAEVARLKDELVAERQGTDHVRAELAQLRAAGSAVQGEVVKCAHCGGVGGHDAAFDCGHPDCCHEAAASPSDPKEKE